MKLLLDLCELRQQEALLFSILLVASVLAEIFKFETALVWIAIKVSCLVLQLRFQGGVAGDKI